MKHLNTTAWFVIVMLSSAMLNSGCARVQPMKIYRSEMDTPYEPLGVIEVRTKARRFGFRNLFWGTIEVLTFSLAPTPSRGEIYQAKLDRKLRKKARKRYKADAIIRAKYWPDLNSPSFPGGFVHARGEMIRFQKFEEPARTSN